MGRGWNVRRKRVQVHCGLVPLWYKRCLKNTKRKSENESERTRERKRERERERERKRGEERRRERRKNDEKPEPVKRTSCAQLPLREPASPFCIQYHLLHFFNNTCIFQYATIKFLIGNVVVVDIGNAQQVYYLWFLPNGFKARINLRSRHLYIFEKDSYRVAAISRAS